jgi:hypothetical protein
MTDIRLIEYEPGRWRVDRREIPVARSDLPMPHVISDIMPPTEQVDGKFYTSKSEFRKVGRSLGLVEVGNEKLKPKTRATDERSNKEKRHEAIRKAAAEYKAGRRPREVQGHAG